MTDQTQGTPVPGWYADPSGQAGVRWWDGTQWTANTAPLPAGAPAPTGASGGVSIYGPFVWLIVFLPLLSSVAIFFFQPDYRITTIDGTPTIDPLSIFSVGYLLVVLTGLVVYALTVVFAVLDHRRLQRIGIRPFHWAFAFLGALVYVIGRSVMVYRAARPRGLATIWALAAMTVVNFVVAMIWAGFFVARLTTTMQELISSR